MNEFQKEIWERLGNIIEVMSGVFADALKTVLDSEVKAGLLTQDRAEIIYDAVGERYVDRIDTINDEVAEVFERMAASTRDDNSV